jgi:type IV secretion system protein VirB9
MSQISFTRVLVSALIVGLLALSLAYAEQIPLPGSADRRVRSAVYNANEVYRVAGRVGYQLTLIFAPGESFVGLAAGDREALTFESQDRWLFLKPRVPRVTTNLTILTNRRQYFLDYRVEPTRIHPDGSTSGEAAVYALQFEYPQDAEEGAAAAAAREAADRIDAALTTPAPVRNARYRYCGPRALKPLSVTDDGVKTRFTFAPTAELPAIFTLGENGTEALVNFTVTSDALIVHRLASRFVLRRGRQVACVINEGYAGGGERLTTGTVSPAVTRERVPLGVQP